MENTKLAAHQIALELVGKSLTNYLHAQVSFVIRERVLTWVTCKCAYVRASVCVCLCVFVCVCVCARAC